MLGSSLSWGAQPGQLWKSSIRGKMLFGGASIVTERSTRKVLGLVAAKITAKARTAAIATAKIAMIRRITGPPWACEIVVHCCSRNRGAAYDNDSGPKPESGRISG